MMYLNADEESLENISNSDGVRMAGDETWQDRAGHGEGTPELGHILQIEGSSFTKSLYLRTGV